MDSENFVCFLLVMLILALPLSILASNNYQREITVQVVSVEKTISPLWWPHTTIRYTDIQLHAVTELETHYVEFAGTYHKLEPGHIYHIKYRMQWNWHYPIVDSIEDMTIYYTGER